MEPEFKIEKEIPIPKNRNPGALEKFPFEKMKVNDSFFVPVSFINENYKNKSSFQSTVCYSGKRHGRKYTVRKVENGYRVWRIK